MPIRAILLGMLMPALLFTTEPRAAPDPASKSPVAWATLASSKESASQSGKTIAFGPAVAALDGRVVAIKGYRVPLEVKTHFLIASKPSDCPDHIEDGPMSFVEVLSKEPMKPTFGRPLTVTGKLELLKNDSAGTYYRLVDAELVSVD